MIELRFAELRCVELRFAELRCVELRFAELRLVWAALGAESGGSSS